MWASEEGILYVDFEDVLTGAGLYENGRGEVADYVGEAIESDENLFLAVVALGPR